MEKEMLIFYVRENLCLFLLVDFFLEILVKIMFFLLFKEIFWFEMISRKFLFVIIIYLRIRKLVDFIEGKWYGEMFLLVIDGIFLCLF